MPPIPHLDEFKEVIIRPEIEHMLRLISELRSRQDHLCERHNAADAGNWLYTSSELKYHNYTSKVLRWARLYMLGKDFNCLIATPDALQLDRLGQGYPFKYGTGFYTTLMPLDWMVFDKRPYTQVFARGIDKLLDQIGITRDTEKIDIMCTRKVIQILSTTLEVRHPFETTRTWDIK